MFVEKYDKLVEPYRREVTKMGQSGHSQGHAGSCSCGCCGCGCGTFPRRFFTAEEKQEKLGNYRDQLKKELKGIEEHLKKCKGK